jgi:hypothetical protein
MPKSLKKKNKRPFTKKRLRSTFYKESGKTNMAQQDVYLRGTVKWAKVQEAADNYDKTGKEYSVDVYHRS